MSLSRSLVDLYVLASAASKVGASALASQTSSVCLHVKTSSLLNPTPVIDEIKIDGIPEIIKPVEVPLNGYVKKDSIPEPSHVAEVSVKGFAEQDNASVNKTMQNVSEKVVKEETFDLDPTKSQYTVREPSGSIAIDIKEAFTPEKRKELKESRIPTSRFGRLWNYGTLATGMGIGAINESFKRATGLSQESSGK
jgi:aarF domain-containing kinase